MSKTNIINLKKYKLSSNEVVYIGFDLEVIREAKISACPKNANIEIKKNRI